MVPRDHIVSVCPGDFAHKVKGLVKRIPLQGGRDMLSDLEAIIAKKLQVPAHSIVKAFAIWNFATGALFKPAKGVCIWRIFDGSGDILGSGRACYSRVCDA